MLYVYMYDQYTIKNQTISKWLFVLQTTILDVFISFCSWLLGSFEDNSLICTNLLKLWLEFYFSICSSLLFLVFSYPFTVLYIQFKVANSLLASLNLARLMNSPSTSE